MIKANIKGIDLTFETSKEVFSPSGVDAGTLAMLSKVNFHKGDKVLDLGCGYGVVGILASKFVGPENVVMCDISDEAIQLAQKNAITNQVEGSKILKSNGLDEITETEFTTILSNPPYHVDFAVPKNFIENGFKKLAIGGKMYMVTKRKNWYKNKLNAIFGGVRVYEIDDYFVFIAEKRGHQVKKQEKPKNQLSKKLAKKYKK